MNDLSIQFDDSRWNNFLSNVQRSGYDLTDVRLTTAVNKALQPALRQAQQLVPVKTGALRRSLTIKTKKLRGGGITWGGIGVQSRSAFITSKGETVRPPKYYYLVEFGRKSDAERARRLANRRAGSGRAIDRIFRNSFGSESHLNARTHAMNTGQPRMSHNRKASTAHPFLAPAIRNAAQAVLNAFTSDIERQVADSIGRIKA
jgi:hypothetical protein